MDPSVSGELERTRKQLLRFADDLRTLLDRERELREEAEQAHRALSGSYTAMARTLAETCEAEDGYTRGHLDRTCPYAMRLLARVAPEYSPRAEVGHGFRLHDIGKVGIPEAILNKPGPLTDERWATMRTHPLVGETIVEPRHFPGDAVTIVRSHHERRDGKDDPDGLAGEDTILPARVFVLADACDAMTTHRPSRKALPIALIQEREQRGDAVTLL